MFDYSSENVGKGLAVVYIERIPEVKLVDGKEVRSTRVKEEVISGRQHPRHAGQELHHLRPGQPAGRRRPRAAAARRSLAAPMEFVDERTVGPSLGKENVERGLTAVLYSFGFALVFFLVYYRMFGVITCIALLLNLLMVIAVMSILGRR
jgi:preprotein translocase subunit SecD